MGYSISEATGRKNERDAKTAKSMMADHPNYRQPGPLIGESLIGFVLRSAAHLVSPPMDNDESYECECIDVAVEIRMLENKLRKKWVGRNSGDGPE